MLLISLKTFIIWQIRRCKLFFRSIMMSWSYWKASMRDKIFQRLTFFVNNWKRLWKQHHIYFSDSWITSRMLQKLWIKKMILSISTFSMIFYNHAKRILSTVLQHLKDKKLSDYQFETETVFLTLSRRINFSLLKLIYMSENISSTIWTMFRVHIQKDRSFSLKDE